MAKDPAFLFYSQDFIVGTLTMSFEDKGKYITLLSMMHQQGRMTEETIRLLVGSISDNLKSKFKIDDSGLWYNSKLESETEKRNKFTESRRNNGSLGGRPKKEEEPTDKPKNNLQVNHTGNLMGNENANENKDVIEVIKSEGFIQFENWIIKNASSVSKMKEPFTQEEYYRLKKDLDPKEVQEILKEMHNKNDLLKKYKSANLTLRSWINLRNKKTPKNDTGNNTPNPYEQLSAALRGNPQTTGLD